MKNTCLLALALCACGPAAAGNDAGQGNPVDSGPSEFFDARPGSSCEKMDIVFIIDNSGSMATHQNNLAQNFPAFANVIDNYVTRGNQLLDYRIGVTTTSREIAYSSGGIPVPSFPAEDGALIQKDECNMSRPWIQRTDPDVVGTFSCLAPVGTAGLGFEMPLVVADWAVDERVADGANDSFFRDDALLAIVILTDEDDCSMQDNNFTIPFLGELCDRAEPIDFAIDTLDTFKGGRGRWATAVIAVPSAGACETAEGVRLKEFVNTVGTNAIFSSICLGDLAQPLQDALDTFDAACQTFPPVE